MMEEGPPAAGSAKAAVAVAVEAGGDSEGRSDTIAGGCGGGGGDPNGAIAEAECGPAADVCAEEPSP